jgi:trehalose/maltose hydrolase-like predicted phosphorylase
LLATGMIAPETMAHALEPTADPAWVFEVPGYDLLRESSLESRFRVSNGFLGVRGVRAVSRGERWIAPSRTYVAGLFDTSADPGAIPELVPAADWLRIRLLLPDGPLVHHPSELSAQRTTHDVSRGVLLAEGRMLKANDLDIRVRTLRLVSLGERADGLQVVEMQFATTGQTPRRADRFRLW